MSCDDIADCIETDDAVRAAINEIAGKQTTPGGTSVPGQRMPDAKWTETLNPTETCDLNVLWAQCSQFVDYVVSAGTDVFEILETYSNAVEAAQFIEMAPFIGTLVDEAQIDQVLQFIDWSLETIQEVYAAADTQPNRQEIACAIFCACQSDCEITLERAWDAINARSGGVFDPSSLNSTESLLTAAITIASSAEFPLEVWMMVVLGLGRTMGYLGVQGINQTLNIILLAAVNDANDDWLLLCDDCPAETQWLPYLINSFQPPDTATGTVVDDGLGHATFTGGFSYGAYRVQFRLWTTSPFLPRCFRITSLSYGGTDFPNNLPCDGILQDGPPVVDECYLGIVAANLTPFTVEIDYEFC